MAHDVFISYAIEDKQTAEAMCRALEEGDVSCWYAPRDIPFGVDYEEAIVDALSDCGLVILILSSHSNNSPHVKREIQNACDSGTGTPILPVRIDDVPLNKALRYYLSSAQWLDASKPPLENHLQQLVEQLRSRLKRSSAPSYPGGVALRAGLPLAAPLEQMKKNAGDVQTGAANLPEPPGLKSVLHHLSRSALVMRWFLKPTPLKTLLVVFGSAVFLSISFAIVVNNFHLQSGATEITTAVLVFLLVESAFTYLYLKFSRRVRWSWFLSLLAILMFSFVAGTGAIVFNVINAMNDE